jgi:peptidoglycan/xylan/chitin deacetylase (PgdA/CDA1 family)
MKKVNGFIICIFLLSTQITFSQKICNWQDDKKGSVVLTFDDWSPGHYPLVKPALKTRGLIATFFILTNDVAAWNHNWPDVSAVAADGNELGNHTVSHPSLLAKTSAELHTEITGAKNLIELNVPSQKVVSFAYPLGDGAGNTAKDQEIRDTIKASGHIASRSVNPPTGQFYTYDFAPTVEDYHKIRTYAMNGSVSTKIFAGETQKVIAGGGMMVYLYHSVDDAANSHGDNWYSKVVIDSLNKQLDTLNALQDKIWVTTFGKAVRYHKERKCATLSEIQAPDGTSWIVNLTDTLSNNSLYNQPLTLKLKMNSVAYDQIIQNGNYLNYTILSDTIMFDAFPDAGNITLSVTGSVTNLSPSIDQLSNIAIDQADGLQTLNLTGITAGGSETQNLTVTAITYNSTLIRNLAVTYTSANATGSLSFTPTSTAVGTTTIIVRVTDDGYPAKYTEMSFTVNVTGTVSAISNEQSLSDKDIRISPIPSTGIITVNTEKIMEDSKVTVDDMSGNKVYENNFSSTDKIQLDFSGQKPGIYILKIRSEGVYIVKKIIII